MTDVFGDTLFYDKVKRLTGVGVAKIEYPGGASRNTIRLRLEDGQTCYATARPKKNRSTRELQILWALDRAAVPAPAVLGVEDTFFLQSDVGKSRLSIALDAAKPPVRAALLRAAAHSLAQAQERLAKGDAAQFFPPPKATESDLTLHAKLPRRAARYFGTPVPAYDVAAVAALIDNHDHTPIKGDTRPANAVLQDSGRMVWIDWDRAASGNRLDDLVCLICDEYVDLPWDTERAIVADCAPLFAPDWTAAERDRYFSVAATLHCLYRMSLIFEKRDRSEGWFDPDACLRKDSLGVSPVYVQRLCRRGHGWSEQSGVLAAVAPLFTEVAQLVTSG